jgi:putative tryptophan/tyrosine transport system substrate-binding protein
VTTTDALFAGKVQRKVSNGIAGLAAAGSSRHRSRNRLSLLFAKPGAARPSSLFIKEVEPIAGALGLTYQILQVRGLEDFEPSFASMRAWSADAVFVLDDATFIASRAAMAAAAARHRLPLNCGAREMAEAGCLFSYSASIKDMWYRSASFVDKILKGAKPADLPVQQGTKFEFVVNLKTARALDFDVPPTLLARADEVIE